MRQNARGLCFAKQPLAKPGVFGRAGKVIQPNGFDGYSTTDRCIKSAVNDAHGAAPELALDAISPDLLHLP